MDVICQKYTSQASSLQAEVVNLQSQLDLATFKTQHEEQEVQEEQEVHELQEEQEVKTVFPTTAEIESLVTERSQHIRNEYESLVVTLTEKLQLANQQVARLQAASLRIYSDAPSQPLASPAPRSEPTATVLRTAPSSSLLLYYNHLRHINVNSPPVSISAPSPLLPPAFPPDPSSSLSHSNPDQGPFDLKLENKRLLAREASYIAKIEKALELVRTKQHEVLQLLEINAHDREQHALILQAALDQAAQQSNQPAGPVEETENVAGNAETESLAAELKELETQLIQKEDELAAQTERADQLQDELVALRAQHSQTDAKAKDQEIQIAELNQIIEEDDQYREAGEEAKSKAEVQIDLLEADAKSLRERFQSADEARQIAETKLRAHDAEFERLSATNAHLAARVKELHPIEERLEALEIQLDRKTRRIQELLDKIESVSNSASEGRQESKEALAEAHTRLERAENSLATATQEAASLNDAIARVTEEKSRVAFELDQKSQQVETLQQQLANAATATATTPAVVDHTVFSAERPALPSSVEELFATAQDPDHPLFSTDLMTSKREVEHQALKQQLSASQSALESLTASWEETQQQAEQRERRLDDLQNKLAAAENAQSDLEAKLESQLRLVDSLRNEHACEIDSLSDSHSLALEELRQSSSSDTQHQLDSLQSSLSSLRSQYQQEVDELQDSIASLRSQHLQEVDELQRSIVNLRSQLQQSEEEQQKILAQIQVEFEAAVQKQQDAEDELSSLRSQVGSPIQPISHSPTIIPIPNRSETGLPQATPLLSLTKTRSSQSKIK